MEGKGFRKSFKLHSLCKKGDSIVDSYEYIYFINGFAYATDGHVAVKVPLDEYTSMADEDWRKLNDTRIHHSLLKVLLKSEDIEVQEEMQGGIQVVSLRTHPKPDNSLVVYLEKITSHPDFTGIMAMKGEPKPTAVLGINATLLNSLSEAMGTPQITLRFTESNGKIFVQNIDSTARSMGVIMPISVTAHLPGFEA